MYSLIESVEVGQGGVGREVATGGEDEIAVGGVAARSWVVRVVTSAGAPRTKTCAGSRLPQRITSEGTFARAAGRSIGAPKWKAFRPVSRMAGRWISLAAQLWRMISKESSSTDAAMRVTY